MRTPMGSRVAYPGLRKRVASPALWLMSYTALRRSGVRPPAEALLDPPPTEN